MKHLNAWHTSQLFCAEELQADECSSDHYYFYLSFFFVFFFFFWEGFRNKLGSESANLLLLVSVEVEEDCKEHLCTKQLVKGNIQLFVLPQEGQGVIWVEPT